MILSYQGEFAVKWYSWYENCKVLLKDIIKLLRTEKSSDLVRAVEI